ncbi:MAG TPA: hypothetical protein VKY24_18020 [Reyranella sp.]|nr:hypothetical protein [Reyranella sp.]
MKVSSSPAKNKHEVSPRQLLEFLNSLGVVDEAQLASIVHILSYSMGDLSADPKYLHQDGMHTLF